MTVPLRTEVAVIGLGLSGQAVATLLLRDAACVYASDAGDSEEIRRAAAELAAMGAAVDVGRHDLERIARASRIVVSPGVPPDVPPIAVGRAAGVPIVSEIEIALAHLRGIRYVGVTGTNGKTTTTALVGHLLRALGYDAVDAGNIGLPLSAVALRDRLPQWVALELSSFQLHDTPSVDPTVAVLTNLSPDHLDRYPTAEAYYADKALLFANAHSESVTVANGDDPAARAMAAWGPGHHYTFSIEDRVADASFVRGARRLDLFSAPLLPRTGLALLGDHNVANALAAVLAVATADASHRSEEARRQLAQALTTFRPLPHRLQLVGEYHGVQWIDDSKATNVSSARVALESMARPTIALLGGRHKGEPYTALAEPLRRTGKLVIAYGEAGPVIERDLGHLVPLERLGFDFEAVMARARASAAPGDVVLLAPACSSFDMFRNYAERGAEFSRLAAEGATPASSASSNA
jgi:UDP-N-acetylmuramoylalanine--D-glutamate ligase